MSPFSELETEYVYARIDTDTRITLGNQRVELYRCEDERDNNTTIVLVPTTVPLSLNV